MHHHDHSHGHSPARTGFGSAYRDKKHYPDCPALTSSIPTDCTCEMNLYRRAVRATLLCALILACTGYLANSVALAGEVFHTLADSLDSFVSLAVLLIVGRHPHREVRARKIGAIIAFGLLLTTVIGIFWWGIHRLTSPTEDVQALIMLAGGIAGLMLNVFVLGHTGHIDEADRSVNHAQLHFHAHADIAIESGVILSAAVIWVSGMTSLDAYTMLAIGLYLLLFIVPRAYQRIAT